MELSTKISLILILLSITSGISQSKKGSHNQMSNNYQNINKNELVKSNISCFDLKFNEYYYNDKRTFKNGSVKLFSYKNGKRFDVLNKLILKNSEYILNIDINEYENLHLEKEDFSKNKKFEDWINHLDLSKIFTLNSESESYQKVLQEMSDESDETLSTAVSCLDKILVYNINVDSKGDKGSPYIEFINIDVDNMKLIDFNSLIAMDQLDAFNKTILSYAENHKKMIVNRYEEKISNGFGDLLASYQNVFEQPHYDYQKVKCKINSSNFTHFSLDGVVFNVAITDRNFLLDKERHRVEEYISEVTVPYKELINYLDKNNSLYSSLTKHVK